MPGSKQLWPLVGFVGFRICQFVSPLHDLNAAPASGGACKNHFWVHQFENLSGAFELCIVGWISYYGDGCHHSLPRDGRVKKRYKDKEGSLHVLQTNKILKLAETECLDMHIQSNITGGLA